MKSSGLVVFQLILCGLGIAFCLSERVSIGQDFYSRQTEKIPVGVYSENEVYVNSDLKDPEAYGFSKAIDGVPDTYACILDSTRTGGRKETSPPFAADPITAEFVLDLGAPTRCVGLRIATPVNWRSLSPKNVSVYVCGDTQGKTGVRALKENAELPPCNSGYSVCVLWEETEARYLLVRVNEGWNLRSRRQGIAPENYFNTQIAELRVLTEIPDDVAASNPEGTPYPEGRLRRDWLLQDAPKIEAAPDECFSSHDGLARERKLIETVLEELRDEFDWDAGALEKELDEISTSGAAGDDPRWRALYYSACAQRRKLRLDTLRLYSNRIIYVKHFVFGGTEGLTGVSNLSDAQYYDQTTERRPGSQLCMLTLNDDGSLTNETLIDKPNGVIRDPNLSWDGKRLVFSMRDSFENDDYSLYEMNLDDRSTRRLTSPPVDGGRKLPCADFEPCYLPEGGFLFASTRHAQINDCWPNDNTDIYSCDADGKHIRRLTYDELDTNFPQITNDGRVVYTRWEYSDRNAYYLHPLFTMNPDGTAQTEFVGNNSMYPASYIQARPVPDSNKLVAIISGHHVPHKGKLALIDRSLGTQDGDCIEYVAGASPDGAPGRVPNPIKTTAHYAREIDMFGQEGPQFQYPYPLDEDTYLVAFCPEGWLTIDGPYTPPFGVYFMTSDGERELLAFDWTVSSGQPIAVAPKEAPRMKASAVDPSANYGTFVVQDVYAGPGLAGVERGTVKKLRVVALEYRAAKVGKGSNAGEVDRGLVQTPISFNNGSWDVKHVLGEVDVEEDGSVAFKAPARTPVYFQLLDERGYCVQTMRSWATLQGGERFACLGCHENKLETGAMQVARLNSIAANKPPQIPRLPDGSLYPLIERLEKESCLDSVQNYLGVNAPALDCDHDARAAGFSYRQEIQPILDRHCVSCHTGESVGDMDNGKAKSSLDLRGIVESVDRLKQAPDDEHKRAFTRSYLNLTNNGKVEGSKWTIWLETRSRSAMLPPYFTGSCKSPIMKYLEPEHYGVEVSDIEKRTFACWIDLLIPFCGSYTDANVWSSVDKITYLYYLQKRLYNADAERKDVLDATNQARKP